ncbi:sec-independent protein translocase protein tatB-like protein [Striga asiatica]|uniref:Sec-independent protein translocase protein tatB-like protein n=1 Tax=Striga asiatica TaxID=4170 RepID=A0A5A7QAL8_STRAF|nr:sec-independent protein translocase protein tatB-like protein [Striga asiatica]
MLGISYGELFLLLGAAAALIGPKDLPVIARTAGRLAGRAIGYVQVTRGQFESVMQQSQARQVHKELQDTMAQLEAIRHEIRSISFMNPGPLTTRLVDNIAGQPPVTNVDNESSKPPEEDLAAKIEIRETSRMVEVGEKKGIIKYRNTSFKQFSRFPKDHSLPSPVLSDIHSQATAYERLAAESPLAGKSMDEVLDELKDESGQFVVLPISAESAKLLPSKKGELRGSDILLEAVLEEDVARNAKGFFSQAQDQITN